MFLEQLGEVRYQDCNGRYRLVRQMVEDATPDGERHERIYQTLFKSGGRCDCTVDRNIVRVPDTAASVDTQVQAILAGPAE